MGLAITTPPGGRAEVEINRHHQNVSAPFLLCQKLPGEKGILTWGHATILPQSGRAPQARGRLAPCAHLGSDMILMPPVSQPADITITTCPWQENRDGTVTGGMAHWHHGMRHSSTFVSVPIGANGRQGRRNRQRKIKRGQKYAA